MNRTTTRTTTYAPSNANSTKPAGKTPSQTLNLLIQKNKDTTDLTRDKRMVDRAEARQDIEDFYYKIPVLLFLALYGCVMYWTPMTVITVISVGALVAMCSFSIYCIDCERKGISRGIGFLGIDYLAKSYFVMLLAVLFFSFVPAQQPVGFKFKQHLNRFFLHVIPGMDYNQVAWSKTVYMCQTHCHYVWKYTLAADNDQLKKVVSHLPPNPAITAGVFTDRMQVESCHMWVLLGYFLCTYYIVHVNMLDCRQALVVDAKQTKKKNVPVTQFNPWGQCFGPSVLRNGAGWDVGTYRLVANEIEYPKNSMRHCICSIRSRTSTGSMYIVSSSVFLIYMAMNYLVPIVSIVFHELVRTESPLVASETWDKNSTRLFYLFSPTFWTVFCSVALWVYKMFVD